tara:strand:- start:1895 stop:6112 length:4218 start_codon:yes stop_codon:yes gene_type:complete
LNWIGQHIHDFIARFRSDVYLEDLSSSSETDILVVDADGKITKNAGAGDDMTFTLTADSGSNQTIVDGETLDVAGGVAISTVVGATDTATVNLDLSKLSAVTPVNGDWFATLDTDGSTEQLTTTTALATLFAGTASSTGLSASSSVLSVTDLTTVGVDGANNQVLTDDGSGGIVSEANLTFDGSTLSVEADANTTANALFIDTNALTTGSAISLDIDDTLTASATKSLVKIDYDKAGVTGASANNTTTGLDINMADAATNHASGTVEMRGINIDLDSASAQGSIWHRGIYMNVAVDGVGDANAARGIEMKVLDGGYDILLRSSADGVDYSSIRTTTNGATTLATLDGDGSNHLAHLTLTADGSLIQNSIDWDVNATGAVTLDSSAAGLSLDGVLDSNFTVTASGQDLDIAVAGGGAQELRLASAGTGAAAMQLTTTAGGIDITTTGAAAGEDIDISTNASINLTSTEAAANAIYLRANGGVQETIHLHADQGTGVSEAASIRLISDAGGITANSTGNVANAILLWADGGANETIKIHSDQGTGAQSIHLLSDDGSVDIDAGDNVTIDAADSMTLTTADTGADGLISLVSGVAGANKSIWLDGNAHASSEVQIDAGILDIDVTGVTTLDTTKLQLTNITTSSATEGGKVNIICDDGAALEDDHQLGKIGFYGAEDDAHTIKMGVKIGAYADAAWSDTENGTRLEFYTMAGDSILSKVLTLDSAKLATFTGNVHLSTDSSVLSMGNGSDFTITHSGTGATLAGNPVHITAGGASTWKTTAGAVLIDSEASTVTVDGHTGVNIVSSNSGEVDITSAANIDINAATGVAIDGTTVSIDGTDDVNVTVTSSTAGEDLTLQQIGGNDSGILITAAGTGTDAIKIDATAGDMLIAPALINGKTLKIGPTSATEMIFTPHGTAANEKISLTNTSGTADDAIKIDAVAGGLTLAAGNDSLHIDADGTDADALNIDSAGGLDIDIAAGTTLDTKETLITSTVTTAEGNHDFLKLDANTSADAAQDATGLYVDFDRTIPGSGTEVHNDIGINLDVSAPSRGAGVATGIDVDVVAASIGSNTAYGIDLTVSGASSIIGMRSTIQVDGATHLQLAHNAGDYANFTMGNHGALEIATVTNSGSATADITLDAAGDIKLEAAGGDITMDSNVTITGGNIKMEANANDYATFSLADTGDLSISTVGDGTTDSDIAITADGKISLVSADLQNARTHGTGGTGIPLGLMHYNFRGWCQGLESENWQYPEDVNVQANNGYGLSTDYGNTVIANGSLGTVSTWFRAGTYYVARDCTSVKMVGWATSAGDNDNMEDLEIAIVKVTPTNDSSAAITPGGGTMAVVTTATFASGESNNKAMSFSHVNRHNIAAGDILIPFVKAGFDTAASAGKVCVFNMSLEVVFRDT